jgi:hypothetical protein
MEHVPLTTDLKAFTCFLAEEISKELTSLSAGMNTGRLMKLVLSKLIVFNKRRPAECAEMKVADYRRGMNPTDNAEVLESLTKLEKAVARRYANISLDTCM